LGQGGWNPFKFSFDEEEYKLMQIRELKHGRLAMIAVAALALQCINSGTGVGSQLGNAFTFPEAVQKAGYYFPEGL
jgi:hypothetical protein